ncbi:MAG: alpha/beta hydrolase [Acidimicrobiales bacterium]
MPAPRTIELPDGRRLAYEEVGDPAGVPVAFHHGTPDSRRARHPDDGLATEAGVRLLAVDRPGIGGSDPHPARTLGSFADDLVVLADALGIERLGGLAWSAGATSALAFAARHPGRAADVAVAAGLVPFEANAEPGILDEADCGRHLIAELGTSLGPAATAEVAVPMLAPIPCDDALALEHVLEGADPRRRAVLDSIPGAARAMAAGVVDAVAQGPAGLQREIELQVEAPDVAWSAVAARVVLVYGALDATAPPAFGRWWAGVLPRAELRVLPDEGHLVALTRWRELLGAIAGR